MRWQRLNLKDGHIWRSEDTVSASVESWGNYEIEPPPTARGRFRLDFYPSLGSKKRPKYLSVWDTLEDAKRAAKIDEAAPHASAR
jgi:hypothetical protein